MLKVLDRVRQREQMGRDENGKSVWERMIELAIERKKPKRDKK